MIKVLTFLSVILIANAIEFELDEATKQLIKEIKIIGNITHNLNRTDCSYKEALIQLDYNNTASPLTATFREECLEKLKDEKFDDCVRDDVFVHCLIKQYTKKVAEMEDKCAEKYNTTFREYLKATEEEEIKNKDFACYRICFLKGIDYIKEDGTYIKLEEIAIQYNNYKCNVTEIAVECIKLGNEEVNECSKSLRMVKCFDQKVNGPDCYPDE